MIKVNVNFAFFQFYYACSITKVILHALLAYIVTSFLRLLTYYIHKLVTLLHVILYSIIFQGVCCPQIC